jgi:hypothetical protein
MPSSWPNQPTVGWVCEGTQKPILTKTKPSSTRPPTPSKASLTSFSLTDATNAG